VLAVLLALPDRVPLVLRARVRRRALRLRGDASWLERAEVPAQLERRVRDPPGKDDEAIEAVGEAGGESESWRNEASGCECVCGRAGRSCAGAGGGARAQGSSGGGGSGLVLAKVGEGRVEDER